MATANALEPGQNRPVEPGRRLFVAAGHEVGVRELALGVVLVEGLGAEGLADQVAGASVEHACLRLGLATAPHEEGDVLGVATVLGGVGELDSDVAVVVWGEVLEHLVKGLLGVLDGTVRLLVNQDNTLLAVDLQDHPAGLVLVASELLERLLHGVVHLNTGHRHDWKLGFGEFENETTRRRNK